MPAQAKKRVIVVGGGLAGLACTIKLAEQDVAVDLFSMVPVKRSHSVCARAASTPPTQSPASRDTANGCISRRRLWAAIFSPINRHFWRWPIGPRASSICSIAWAFPSMSRPRASVLFVFSADRSSSELSTPARPPASNCSTPWMSKPVVGKPTAKSPNTNSGNSSGPCCTMGNASELSLRTCARCKSAPSAPTPSSWPPAETECSSAKAPCPSSAPAAHSRAATRPAHATPTPR